MKISELIEELRDAMERYGDHTVTTYAGEIVGSVIVPCKDGISYPLTPGTHNELSIEILTKP